jgi:crotonobetainyl-CoA:carnitine CoA-transferase CaiB-like acyl-CoA transferase
MCPALGLPELTTDARFTTNAPRIENRTGQAGELGLPADELERLQGEGAISAG